MTRMTPGPLGVALACLAGAGELRSAQTPRLGTIDFPTSGAPAAQVPFVRGVLLLHSFEYQDALQAFREAQRIDSGFALAYWGEALAYTHPVWNEQDQNAARAALQRLGLSQGVRDTATYLRAAAIVEPVFRDNPNHPGAAHVLIHCYDDPIHAPLGLAAARAYSKIAPDAAHAQHMTTHIFLALGMWDEVVAQNEIASGGDRAAWTPHHYTEWLGYGYLQQGRYQEALQHLELMHQNMNQARRGRPVLAEMRADYVVNTERWDSPCLQWSIDLTGVRARDAAVDVFVAGLSALKRGDRRGAERGLADLAAVNRSRAPAAPGQERDQVPDILLKELEALLRQADSAPTDAIALMREATALEDAMSVEFGPPADVKPAHELFGEIL